MVFMSFPSSSLSLEIPNDICVFDDMSSYESSYPNAKIIVSSIDFVSLDL
jgi:hypothetical protein